MWELVRDIPDVSVLLDLAPEKLAAKMLFLMKKRQTSPGTTPLTNNGMFTLGNLENEMWPAHNNNAQPQYPRAKVDDVNLALTEAWAWLEAKGLLIPASGTNGRNGWRVLSRRANSLEKETDLIENSTPEFSQSQSEQTLIADTRLAELRKLSSAKFDFKKLIRLCEEINVTYREKCYLATAMLTRALLDHVPPLFGKTTFREVANNYGGGGKSFKDAMHHLNNPARYIADAHLHTTIRQSETLPTAQQVNFSQELDLMLGEIIRITP